MTQRHIQKKNFKSSIMCTRLDGNMNCIERSRMGFKVDLIMKSYIVNAHTYFRSFSRHFSKAAL